MQKLFKNSKQVLAFVMAFAIIAVSLVTAGATVNADACSTTNIDYWDGTKATKFASGDGSEANPYIIETAEQMAFACLGQNPASSTGKYYKVSDKVDVFVMQPEAVVDFNTLVALDSAEAVKDYLTGLNGIKNWQDSFNLSSFNGHMDGNGIVIYGLYADSVNKISGSKDDCGLIPQYDGGRYENGVLIPNVCKNITVKNSYYKAQRRLGGIAGAAYGTNYGAKVDGKVIVDTCAMVNCYMEGNAVSVNHYQEQGVVIGGGGLDMIEINNIFVKGVYAYDTVQKKKIPVIGSASNAQVADPEDNTKKIYTTKVTNSVFLGIAPYQADYYTGQLCEPHIFSNVVTDQASGKVTINNPSGWGTATSVRDYTNRIWQVTSTGFDFVNDSADVLDWNNTWFMSEQGPELRALHGEIKFTANKNTHLWVCEECGITSPGGEQAHNFVLQGDAVVGDGSDVYACSVCAYVCQHNDQGDVTYDAGDCVTDSGFYSRCQLCDWYIVQKDQDAPGHKFTHVEADPGHCELNGHKEYWYCEVCDNKFASDDTMAPMANAVSDEWLDTGLGGHIKDEDGDGIIVLYDKNGHWYVCSVDGGRLDAESNAIAEDEVVEHKFSNAKCSDCGYVCTNHEYEETGKLASIHSCTSDEKAEIKCKLCGYKTSYVTKKAAHKIVKMDEVKADDRMEGTKSHYKCSECKEIYADAEGATKITQASLVIPKVLPEEYRNMVNADSGDKSPSTGDNLASLISVAAIASAVLVFARKK